MVIELNYLFNIRGPAEDSWVSGARSRFGGHGRSATWGKVVSPLKKLQQLGQLLRLVRALDLDLDDISLVESQRDQPHDVRERRLSIAVSQPDCARILANRSVDDPRGPNMNAGVVPDGGATRYHATSNWYGSLSMK